jgi:DNA polymerase/3'-5' exonuclease PolX
MHCQEYISAAILEAARAAVPADVEQLMLLPGCGPRNKPLMPLLIGLVEALRVTAEAVADNAMDEGYPVDARTAAELQRVCVFARSQISTAGLVPK